MKSLMFQFRIHKSTISQHIKLVCRAIYYALAKDYKKTPDCKEE